MNIQYAVPISAEARNLIERMLVIKPDDRISLPELLCHPWLKYIIGPDGIPIVDDEEDDFHDFNMSLSLQRQECNLNPMQVKGGRPQNNGDITDRCKKAIDDVQ